MGLKKGKWYKMRELPYETAKLFIRLDLGDDVAVPLIKAYEDYFFTTDKAKTSTDDLVDYIEQNAGISFEKFGLII